MVNQPELYEPDYRVMPDGEIREAPSRKSRGGMIGLLGAILLFVATKFKFLLGALKGFKFFGTVSTAVLSIGAYALAFGWQFGVGLVVLLFIHEMGHVLALRRFGVKATAPIFIPFLGAYIGMKQLPKNAYMEAFVGLGGPVIGALGALAAWVLYTVDGHPIFLVLTYIGVLLNLFNLLPVLPLDGGRAVGAISRWFWAVGYAGLLFLMIVRPNPILLLVLLFGAPEVWNAIRNRGSQQEYYAIPLRKRALVGATYFGLLLVLGVSLYELSPLLTENRPG